MLPIYHIRMIHVFILLLHKLLVTRCTSAAHPMIRRKTHNSTTATIAIRTYQPGKYTCSQGPLLENVEAQCLMLWANSSSITSLKDASYFLDSLQLLHFLHGTILTLRVLSTASAPRGQFLIPGSSQ